MKIDKLKDSILIIVAFILGGVLTYVVVNGNLTTSSKGTTSSGGATCSSKNCTKVLVDGSGISQSVSKVYDGVVIVRNYQNNEGKTVYVTEVNANNITFLSSKGNTNSAPVMPAVNQTGDINHVETNDFNEDPFKDFGSEVVLSDDDLPF